MYFWRREISHFEIGKSLANGLGLVQPILASKVLDPGKFLFVVGDDGVTKCKRLRRNEQVIGADWSASLLKPGTQ